MDLGELRVQVGPNFGQTPQQELAEAHGLLDLAKHGLDHLFPQAVGTPPAPPFQLRLHGRNEAPRLAVFAVGRSLGSVLLASGRDVGPDVSLEQAGQIGFRAEARIG
jgi:hypothetical protein